MSVNWSKVIQNQTHDLLVVKKRLTTTNGQNQNRE